MRHRFLISLALALLGAVVAAGAVSAQGNEAIAVGEAGVEVNLPNGANLPVIDENLPACANTRDDDGDGLSDLDDPGCEGPADEDETDPPADDSGDPREPPVDSPADGSGKGDKDKGGSGSGPNNLPDTENPFEQPAGESKQDAKDDDGRKPDTKPDIRRPDGAPSNSNPSVTIVPSGPAPIGVPNFVIDQFTIPPFLLPLYQACGTQYGIPWQVLASINRIETAFGTNLNVSSAGALGWMQFMPATWKAYGVDANADGRKDPYNPVDAICAAARYLKASGGETDLRKAIFAYNHADWYVDEVLLYAKQYGKLPSGLVNSLTGLTEGAQFPVAAKARYADDISEREAERRSTPRRGVEGNAADVISDSPTRRGIDIFAKEGAPVVAVNDGRIRKVGKNKRLGRHIVLEDAYGNQFTYAKLGRQAKAVPSPKERELTAKDFRLVTPGKDKKKPDAEGAAKARAANSEDARERLFALPERPANRDRADLSGQLDEMLGKGVPGYETFKAYFTGVLEFDPETMETVPLRKGTKVVAGTVLGRIGGESDGVASHVHFGIEPAGRGARKIDPKPILDGWKLLEATAIYRAAGKNPFTDRVSVGQILLMSKAQLTRRVLKDTRIEIYECGRQDIRTGQVDRRVLASLAYLAERGFRPTVTSLKCGRAGVLTKSGNVSHHVSGNAVDIARLNGIPILGNQGPGSITEAAVKDLLKLQGALQPAQIITLMEMGGPTFAMADHADHIHLGFNPSYGPGEDKQRYAGLLNPDQWDRLLDRIGELDQPDVPTKPSKYSLPGKRVKRASHAHIGE